jgi:hypothetical protein
MRHGQFLCLRASPAARRSPKGAAGIAPYTREAPRWCPSDPLPEPSTGLITRKSGGTIDFLFRVRDRLLTFCLFTAQLGLRRGRGVQPHPRRGARSSRERSPLAPIHGALKVLDRAGETSRGRRQTHLFGLRHRLGCLRRLPPRPFRRGRLPLPGAADGSSTTRADQRRGSCRSQGLP